MDKYHEVLKVCDTLILGDDLRIPFLGRGNIWLKNSYNKDTLDLTRNIIYQALNNTAVGQLSIIGLDADLSGLFAPFISLASGLNNQLELLFDTQSLDRVFNEIGQHIQAVQNVIQAQCESLIDFRNKLERPIEHFKLVVLYMNFKDTADKFLERFHMLLQRAPQAGVSFLIIPSNNKIGQEKQGQDEMTPQFLDEKINVIGAIDSKVALFNEKSLPKKVITFFYKNPAELIQWCANFVENAKKTELPTVRFAEIHDVSTYWKHTSEHGLTFFVGKYGDNVVDITIGDEINQRHNALITGAVGQGKSNLISVIIHSLCLRYSPDELNLYLLDFKEGVSLEPFCNIGRDEYLPHAKVVGLESDIELGYAVLEHLYSEYLRRLKIFKSKKVKSLREFRKIYPKEVMPRIVAIIDEFQLMFGEDANFGQKVVDLLEKSVRLFRAAGIHFIFASQSISGNTILRTKKDSIFSQVPIRIAHKNSLIESLNTLGPNNGAAASLRPREAIVNVDYGEISQNKKTIIAYADENVLEPIRHKWWECASSVSLPPYIFENEKRIPAINAIQTVRKDSIILSSVPYALLGERISISGEKMAIPLPSEPGRNIAIIGSPDAECNNAEGIIQGIIFSLASQHRSSEAMFLFCDFREKDEPIQDRFPAFYTQIENLGIMLHNIPQISFQDTLAQLLCVKNPPAKIQTQSIASTQSQVDEIAALFGDGKGDISSSQRIEIKTAVDYSSYRIPDIKDGVSVYVIAMGLDRWPYNKDTHLPPPLKNFVESAPEKGIHFIGWWEKLSNYKAQVSGLSHSDTFNSKVFLRIGEDEVRSLTNPRVRWKPEGNRALLSDDVNFSQEIVFIPYSPIKQ